MEFVTLHVGLGTFKSPTQEQIENKKLHTEWFSLSKDTADFLNNAKKSGRRIITVGTTTTRVLESCSDKHGILKAQAGETDIFIYPPYNFRFVDGLITNFHLPGSSLLMLVSAFSSTDIIKHAYSEAISNNYRFFSFGDACLII
jgi:S-adenosylmethionine:tRNA ribosyltransferase-isomerase